MSLQTPIASNAAEARNEQESAQVLLEEPEHRVVKGLRLFGEYLVIGVMNGVINSTLIGVCMGFSLFDCWANKDSNANVVPPAKNNYRSMFAVVCILYAIIFANLACALFLGNDFVGWICTFRNARSRTWKLEEEGLRTTGYLCLFVIGCGASSGLNYNVKWMTEILGFTTFGRGVVMGKEYIDQAVTAAPSPSNDATA